MWSIEEIAHVPKSGPDHEASKKKVADSFAPRAKAFADDARDVLIEFCGKKEGEKISYAESCELCEQGDQSNQAELRKLFPFFN